MVNEDTQQSVWNFDGAELLLIFEIKAEVVSNLQTWELESAYWKLRDLRRELDAKLGRKEEKFEGIVLEEDKEKHDKKKKKTKSEKDAVDEKLKILEEERRKYNLIGSPSEKERGEYYLNLEEFYMHLCHLMKKHGIYFREGEDSRMAVLRR